MRKVLHVGPCDSPGGMATVMRILAEHPPEGWEAELLASHASGGLWAKWRAYRKARRELKRRCADAALRPDVVHVHTAADWSWRRKARLIDIVTQHEVSAVVHFHSGNFRDWLQDGGSRRTADVRGVIERENVVPVVLSKHWAELLRPFIGEVLCVPNPVRLPVFDDTVKRRTGQMLLLGRDDPVKGHDFGIEVTRKLNETRGDISLVMTGRQRANSPTIQARGWISESEKIHLLRESSILLLPSLYEGQPMVVLEALAHGLPVLASSQLHSLPASVHLIPRTVQDWAQFLEDFFQSSNRPSLATLPDEHKAQHVSELWEKVYRSLVND